MKIEPIILCSCQQPLEIKLDELTMAYRIECPNGIHGKILSNAEFGKQRAVNVWNALQRCQMR